jgi:hypothetical protein
MARRKPPLTEAQILAWADAHYERTGRWPAARSGPIPEVPGEVWTNIESALYDGHRGLPGGDSLARLLNRHRKRREHGWVVWMPAEDAWVRTLPPAQAAARTGRTLRAVYQRRHVLGVGFPPHQQG